MSEETEYKVGDVVFYGERKGVVTGIRELGRPCDECGETMHCCPDYDDCPEAGTAYDVELDPKEPSEEPMLCVVKAYCLCKYDRRTDATVPPGQGVLDVLL